MLGLLTGLVGSVSLVGLNCLLAVLFLGMLLFGMSFACLVCFMLRFVCIICLLNFALLVLWFFGCYCLSVFIWLITLWCVVCLCGWLFVGDFVGCVAFSCWV